MKVDHYENFPVASVLLPRRLRAAVGVVYHFARGADDIADEGDADAATRHAGLAAYRAGLDGIAAACVASSVPSPPATTAAADNPRCAPDPGLAALFAALARVVHAHGLSLRPFYDLLDAFDQDVDVKRYADFAGVRDYCRRSADPVGRIMLALLGADDARNVSDADDICTALQLINFWQDVGVDWQKNRIYLPLDDMACHGVTEQHIADARCDAAWRALMAFEVARAEAMMRRGAPLAARLGGRFGLELRLVVQGGLRILEKIRAADYDVFRQRPVLGWQDGPLLLARALTYR
ncbi:MAG: squalene synthase HpnC [Janthinobacterium lividum]